MIVLRHIRKIEDKSVAPGLQEKISELLGQLFCPVAEEAPFGDFDRPKLSLTHHFKALRDAGVIRQRQYGLERRSRLRSEDLDQRFPGLLALVENWSPPMEASSRHGKKPATQA